MTSQSIRTLWSSLAMVMAALSGGEAWSGNLPLAIGTSTVTSYRQTQIVQDLQPVTETLDLAGAGQLTLAVTDYSVSSLFGPVDFGVTDAGGTLIPTRGQGSVTIDVSGPTTLYVDLFAAGSSVAGLGLYNLEVNFTPASLFTVPLPPSGTLLGMGGLLLAGMVRLRNRRATVTMTVA